MNNFRDDFSFYLVQISFCVLFIYITVVNPTEAGRNDVVPSICLGLVGVTVLVGDCRRRLELLRKRLKELEVNFEERS